MRAPLLFFQSQLTPSAIIEIILITAVVYYFLGWIKDTQAEQVMRGIIVLLLILPLSDWLGFSTINFLVKSLFTWIFLFILVVFQPELRSMLETLGNSGFLPKFTNHKGEIKETTRSIDEIIAAVTILSEDHTGALLVCENNTGLKNIANSGIRLNSRISWELLVNLFTVNRPLHDGAVILSLQRNEVIAAGCLLPLTEKKGLNSSLGTRHRAGIGMSERSDALVIIVSEETGIISYVTNGNLFRNVAPDVLREVLTNRYVKPLLEEQEKNTKRWGRRNEN